MDRIARILLVGSSRMRRGTKTWLGRVMAAAFAAGTLGYMPYHLYAHSGLARTLKLRQELATLRARNATLATENQRLQREAESLQNDPDAIERVARVELGWIRPGEIIVDLSPVSGLNPGATSILDAGPAGAVGGNAPRAARRVP